MERIGLKLQPSEQTVVTAAATIYAAYIKSGKVNDENQEEMLEKSVVEAIHAARLSDELIRAEKEVG